MGEQGCPSCGGNRPIRKCSGLCHSCHRRATYQRYKEEMANDAKFDSETTAARQRIREAFYALSAAWAADNPAREELTAFELIEAVEDYLGKV